MDRPFIVIIMLTLLISANLLPDASSAQTTVNWTGATSADWSTPGNWSTGSVPGSSDKVQVGLAPFNHQPQISGNVQAGSILFGGEYPDTLTVNSSYTLLVNGGIFQSHAANNIAPLTLLKGSGNIVCDSIVVGNNVLSKVVIIKNTTLVSKVSSLTINGKLRINSSTIDLLSGAIAHNNAIFSLNGGQLTLNGQIYLDNFIPAYLTTLPGKKPLSKFMISIDTNINATLKLTDSSSVTLLHTGYDSVDFYHPAGGSGKSIVNYAGGNQLLYTNNGAGIDTLPYTYQNIYVTTAGNKTAGSSTTNNRLSAGGNVTITNGNFDLYSFSAGCTVYSNFVNRATTNVGAPGIVFNGASFVNDSTFNHNNAWITFSGGTQALTDSTHNGTSLRFLAFADTGTKHINHGIFNMIPSGKVKLSNNVTVQVDSTGTFILAADSTGIAAVTAIPGGSVIKGIVNAQGFAQGSPGSLAHRGYLLLSPPVNHTNKTDGTGDYNPNWIKGTTLYDGSILTGLNGTSNGFTQSGNPTLYIYREDVNSTGSGFVAGNYRGVNKINDTTDINNVWTQKRFQTGLVADTIVRLHVGNGMLFFFRGNKVSPNGTTAGTKTTAPYNYPEDVTYTNKGTVNQGQVQVKIYFRNNNYLSYTDSSYISNASARGFNFVGNPYPSAINLDNFSATDSTAAIYGPGLVDTITILRPYTSTILYDHYEPNPSHNRDSIYSGSGSATNIIPSGGGFFVRVDPTSPSKLTATLRFRETAKFNPPNTMGSMSSMFMLARRATRATVIKKKSAPVKKKSAVPLTLKPKPDLVIHLTLNKGRSVQAMVILMFTRAKQSGMQPGLPPDPDTLANAVASLYLVSGSGRKQGARILPLTTGAAAVTVFISAEQSGNFALDGGISGMPTGYTLTLEDKYSGKTVNLVKQHNYDFAINTTDKKSYGSRFVLHLTKTH